MALDPDTISATVTALFVGLAAGGKAIHMWTKKDTESNGNSVCRVPSCSKAVIETTTKVGNLEQNTKLIFEKLDQMPNRIIELLSNAKGIFP